LALLLAAACAGSGGDAREPAARSIVADGRAIAERQCASCHAIGRRGESPNPEAPPFRILLSRYDAEALTTNLNEGARIGHAGMPEFELPIQGVDALVAYVRTIQTEAPRE
jgi:mono/diheme cytochrome c family protein